MNSKIKAVAALAVASLPVLARADTGTITLPTGLDPTTVSTAILTAISTPLLTVVGIAVSISLFVAIVVKFVRLPKKI